MNGRNPEFSIVLKNNNNQKYDSLNPKKLGIDTQTFKTLITEDYLYVDKTKEILKLINDGRIYFLSRPRKFGKSLLVSTLKSLFSGEKELFKDLYIYDKWDWNENYTVIHLDMSDLDNSSTEKLEVDLHETIDRIAESNNITINKRISVRKKFSNLITDLYNLKGKKIVVLVDEYDAPILDNINDPKLVDTNRKTLERFYQSLKTLDGCIKFILITGISKFIHASIFSKLNNPTDISLSNNYSTICGITKNEMNQYCGEHIQRFADKNNLHYDDALDEINRWYDGYSFDGKKRVFNPYSTLSALKEGKLSHYWFRTGTPH
ncbi:MAG: AAA family ATPase, partial [Methanobrevibacter sp.]|nr:AAA family ATPase [Methanobrevibacter sp.]